MMREYTCPKCSKIVTFPIRPSVKKRQCPHCGREIMDWDGKPDRQQHGGKKENWLPIIVFAIVVAGMAAGVYLYFRK
jgi:DNA-directed RNA polymerase subunit RPC12/RpoP